MTTINKHGEHTMVCGEPLTETQFCVEPSAIDHNHPPTKIDRTTEHIAFVDQRYRYTEDDINWYSEPRPIMCRSWGMGSEVLCDPCEADLLTRYPQGWKYYPGDKCEHNVYVGGSGIDWMCPQCEFGDE